MRELYTLVLSTLILLSLIAAPIYALAMTPQLMVVEWSIERVNGWVTLNVIPPEDNSMNNPNYKLLPFKWKTTAKFWINPTNKYGFSASSVVGVVNASANIWDEQSSFQVFQYMGTISRSAGRYDGYNVVSWGPYRAGVIAVTYIWYVGDTIIETDTRLNTYYAWSLTGYRQHMVHK